MYHTQLERGLELESHPHRPKSLQNLKLKLDSRAKHAGLTVKSHELSYPPVESLKSGVDIS